MDDLKEAAKFGPYDAVFVINVALAHYAGPIDYAVTLHPELLAGYMETRAAKDLPMPRQFVAHKGNPQEGRSNAFPIDRAIEYQWPGADNSGSSGLFAIKVAMEFGYERRVLAGVPMDPAQGYVDDPNPWTPGVTFWKAWEQVLPLFCEGTRSVSGKTRELLGPPTAEWICA